MDSTVREERGGPHRRAELPCGFDQTAETMAERLAICTAVSICVLFIVFSLLSLRGLVVSTWPKDHRHQQLLVIQHLHSSFSRALSIACLLLMQFILI